MFERYQLIRFVFLGTPPRCEHTEGPFCHFPLRLRPCFHATLYDTPSAFIPAVLRVSFFLDSDSAATPSLGRRVGPRPNTGDNAVALSFGGLSWALCLDLNTNPKYDNAPFGGVVCGQECTDIYGCCAVCSGLICSLNTNKFFSCSILCD